MLDMVNEHAGGVSMATVGHMLWRPQVVLSPGMVKVDGIKLELRKITIYNIFKK